MKFPVQLCTTKLAQSTSQHYFVIQSLHKARPSTTLYYKTCTKHFPALLCTTTALLCTTKLAQSTSQYHFGLQTLHKVRPSTTLDYKPCTKYVPVLLCDTKFAQRKLLHIASSFAEKFYTQHQLFKQRSFYTPSFTHSKLYRKQITQRSFPVQNHNRNCSSKAGSRRQSGKNAILKHFLKGFLKGK